MKIKITLFLLCFGYFQNSISQSIKGKVISNKLPIHNVEVINTNSKVVINTNQEGAFEIKAITSNWITFYHKDYDVVKIYVDSLFDFNKSLEIELFQKSTKIEEVQVEKKQSLTKGMKYGMPVIPYNKPSVYFSDGTVNTPVDFIQVFGLIKKLFKNKDKVDFKPKLPIQFRTFTAQSYSNEFLIKSMKLKQEEIEEFLNYCSFDSKSKEAVENSDKLILLQFLIEKSEEFKKLHQK
ncbi:hypothetical protein [Flavobacterium sp.]|jgi:hypothetical protein|uniref:hypothetical protein n=1 Tax=Flavobacterium sp. TaxID=239 RepID=UPI0037C0C043